MVIRLQASHHWSLPGRGNTGNTAAAAELTSLLGETTTKATQDRRQRQHSSSSRFDIAIGGNNDRGNTQINIFTHKYGAIGRVITKYKVMYDGV
jgi:hypothetical protein